MEEEVWKDINLSALPESSSSSTTTTASDQLFPSAILQDFFSIPLLSSCSSPTTLDSSSFIDDISPHSQSHHPKLPLLPFGLDYSDPPDFGLSFLETQPPFPSNPPHHQTGSTSSNTTPTVQLKKKAPQKSFETPEKRFVRLMKNRDSANRARARKEVYTKELEVRLAHLKKENALLHKQLNSSKKKEAAATNQCPKKRTSLYRTLTAPF